MLAVTVIRARATSRVLLKLTSSKPCVSQSDEFGKENGRKMYRDDFFFSFFLSRHFHFYLLLNEPLLPVSVSERDLFSSLFRTILERADPRQPTSSLRFLDAEQSACGACKQYFCAINNVFSLFCSLVCPFGFVCGWHVIFLL